MKKYTTEELSKILSCAAVGQLGKPFEAGQETSYCIEQTAASTMWGISGMPKKVQQRANWYDQRFSSGSWCNLSWEKWVKMSPQRVLQELEKGKLA